MTKLEKTEQDREDRDLLQTQRHNQADLALQFLQWQGEQEGEQWKFCHESECEVRKLALHCLEHYFKDLILL